MQILLNSPEEENLKDHLLDPVSERSQIDVEYGLHQADEVHLVNIGAGADWMVYLAVFNVAWTVFQLPGIIKDSYGGWIWLVDLIKSFKSKGKLISLDQDAAGILSIDFIADRYGNDSALELIDAHTVPLLDISGMVHNKVGGLPEKPFNYFLFTFRVLRKIIIVGVRPNGDVKELDSFEDCSCLL